MNKQREGLACPNCSRPMSVTHTRKGDGLVKRRRLCESCNYCETTHERPIGVPRPGRVPDMARIGQPLLIDRREGDAVA